MMKTMTKKGSNQHHQLAQPIFLKKSGGGYGTSQIALQGDGQLRIHGIGDQGISNGLIQCGGITGMQGMVGLGEPLGVATGSLANQLSSDGIGKSIHPFLRSHMCLMEA